MVDATDSSTKKRKSPFLGRRRKQLAKVESFPKVTKKEGKGD